MPKKRKKSLADAATCPRFKIHTIEHGHGWRKLPSAADFEMSIDGRHVGRLMTSVQGKALEVTSIAIDDPDQRRCGLGTKLYEAAAKWGCTHDLKLTSDVLRSVDSQGFWEKQARKGRARCMVGASAKAPDDGSGPRIGRGGCGMYQLISCDSTDLSRRRRRKKS